MEQRRLRLGDILDDYCPRERRVTNHAVVAMVEEDVKQTRCTTCDAEHVYKGGRAPRRKKTETTGRLYKQVLAGLTDPENAAASANGDLMDDSEQLSDSIDASLDSHAAHDASADEPIDVVAEVVAEPESSHDAVDPVDPVDDDSDDQPPMPDEGPVHRPLIRAQLPRIEGLKLERQAPEFTIRQNAGRGNGHFRGGGGGGGGTNNGQRFGRGPHRGGGRGGAGQGFGRGQGGGNQQRHGGGPRKRGR